MVERLNQKGPMMIVYFHSQRFHLADIVVARAAYLEIHLLAWELENTNAETRRESSSLYSNQHQDHVSTHGTRPHYHREMIGSHIWVMHDTMASISLSRKSEASANGKSNITNHTDKIPLRP